MRAAVCVCELMPLIHKAGYETKRSPSGKPLGEEEGIKGEMSSGRGD